jgi:hypothetical protein
MGNNLLESGTDLPEDGEIEKCLLDLMGDSVNSDQFRDLQKKESGIYEEIYRLSINPDIDIRIPEPILRLLLSNLPIWKDLPFRVKRKIGNEVIVYMMSNPMPTQKQVEEYIQNHPVVAQHERDELPASLAEMEIESREAAKRTSDIEALKRHIKAEAELVSRLDELEVFKDSEIPTKRDTPIVPKRGEADRIKGK